MLMMVNNCEEYCLLITIDTMIDMQIQKISRSYANTRDYNGEDNCVEMRVFDVDDDGGC
jgi:hypothetical protein